MQKRYLVYFLLILHISIASGNSIQISSVADTLYIGQLINIELDLSEYQPERLFILKEKSTPEIEIFDLLTLRDKPWQYLLRIAPFDTGFIQTESIPIYFSNNNIGDTLYIEPFSFYVKSALTYADTLLRDIAPPKSFRLKFVDYLIPVLILLVLVLLHFYIHKFKKKDEEPEYVDNRPAWMIAFELLEQFKRKNFLHNGRYLEYYFELSLIFRIFIEKQFNIKAAEMTTYEIKQALAEIEQKKQIIKILSEMDIVKFAKSVPVIKEAESMLYWIEKYILSFSAETTGKVSARENVISNEADDV